MGGGIITLHHHKDVHVLIPETCEYVTLNSKGDSAPTQGWVTFGSALGGSKSPSIHSYTGILDKIRHVTYGLLQYSTKAEHRLEMRSFRKDLWRRDTFPNKINPQILHRKSIRFLKILYEQKYCLLGLKGTERTKECSGLPKHRTLKLLSSKHVLPFMKKEGLSKGRAMSPQG